MPLKRVICSTYSSTANVHIHLEKMLYMLFLHNRVTGLLRFASEKNHLVSLSLLYFSDIRTNPNVEALLQSFIALSSLPLVNLSSLTIGVLNMKSFH